METGHSQSSNPWIQTGPGGLGPNRSKREARHCRTHARAVSFVSAEEASLRRGRGARESTGGGGDAVHASSVASMKRSSFILKSKTGRACGGLDAANSRCHYCGTSLTCREYSPSSGSPTEGLLRAEAFAAFGFSCGGFARVLLWRVLPWTIYAEGLLRRVCYSRGLPPPNPRLSLRSASPVEAASASVVRWAATSRNSPSRAKFSSSNSHRRDTKQRGHSGSHKRRSFVHRQAALEHQYECPECKEAMTWKHCRQPQPFSPLTDQLQVLELRRLKHKHLKSLSLKRWN